MPQRGGSGLLFPEAEGRGRQTHRDAPLADRIRPLTLDEILGQEEILGPDKPLRRAIEADPSAHAHPVGPARLGNDPQPQLYNLPHDLGERQNLAEKHPERVAEMAAELARIRDRGRTRR